MPQVLVGLLTLGAGLAAGLALSSGPITYVPGSALPVVVSCVTSTSHDRSRVECASPGSSTIATFWFAASAKVPNGFDRCVSKVLATSRPQAVLRKCE
jgi:hypothetical protein